ncbi:hypothetical protein [Corynebacterium sp. TAE3-ERU16]|uniref:hypothetical protein n=1 Tax=Corynebacterium sp. TAE3-ERU16 TaxID=2849493 RepID=UPI001C44E816|nr:hypothetical protein [Corynebacterium sp. TAE3-ERU16]
MKTLKHLAPAAAVVAALSLAACSGDEAADSTSGPASSSAAPTSAAAGTTEQPTAEELNAILATATDPAASVEDKIRTVQGGENAPELFETMTRSKQESGADFQVVPPVLPGYENGTVLATVNFTLPDRPSQVAENVEFVYVDGTWQLSQSWACTLITNTVPPEQVPPMCLETGSEEVPPLDPAAPAEAPAEAPAGEAPAQ